MGRSESSISQHYSRHAVRSRILAGCAAAMTGVLVCSAAPPAIARGGGSIEVRAVRLTSLVESTDADPILLDVPTGHRSSTQLAPDAQSVIPTPSGDLGPGLHIFFGLAQLVVQPLAWIGDLLPTDLQQYYYIFVYLPIALPLSALGFFADAAINSVLGVPGYQTTSVASDAAVDAVAPIAVPSSRTSSPPSVSAPTNRAPDAGKHDAEKHDAVVPAAGISESTDASAETEASPLPSVTTEPVEVAHDGKDAPAAEPAEADADDTGESAMSTAAEPSDDPSDSAESTADPSESGEGKDVSTEEAKSDADTAADDANDASAADHPKVTEQDTDAHSSGTDTGKSSDSVKSAKSDDPE